MLDQGVDDDTDFWRQAARHRPDGVHDDVFEETVRQDRLFVLCLRQLPQLAHHRLAVGEIGIAAAIAPGLCRTDA